MRASSRETGGFKVGKPYHLVLRLDGQKVELQVNGRKLWSIKDPAPLPGGVVWLGGAGRVLFDDVKITGRISTEWLRARKLVD